MITFDPALEAKVASGHMNTAVLVAMFLNGATLRYTDYQVDVAVAGSAYLASAALLDVPTLAEKEDEPITTGSVTLSNVTGQFNTIFRDTNQLFTPVTIYVADVDAAGQVTGILKSRKLYITGVVQNESQTSDSYEVSLSNYLVDFTAIKGRTTSENSQVRYAEEQGLVDTSFRHTNVLKSNVPWGK